MSLISHRRRDDVKVRIPGVRQAVHRPSRAGSAWERADRILRAEELGSKGNAAMAITALGHTLELRSFDASWSL